MDSSVAPWKRQPACAVCGEQHAGYENAHDVDRAEPGTYRYTDDLGRTITFDYHGGRVSNVREVC